MPEPRPEGDLAGTKATGRTKLLGEGGKAIAPEPTPEAEPAPPQAPAAPTPAAALQRPPWDNGGIHVGCLKGGRFRNLAVGSPRRRCKCGEEWAWLRAEKRWVRVE